MQKSQFTISFETVDNFGPYRVIRDDDSKVVDKGDFFNNLFTCMYGIRVDDLAHFPCDVKDIALYCVEVHQPVLTFFHCCLEVISKFIIVINGTNSEVDYRIICKEADMRGICIWGRPSMNNRKRIISLRVALL